MKQICTASLALFILVTLCACGRQAIPPAATAAPQTPPPLIPIQRAKFLDRVHEADSTTNTGTNRIRWEVRIAEFSEAAIEQHGLKHLFDQAPQNNLVISEEIARSHLISMARGNTNIGLHLTAGVHAGTCSPAVASNLVTYFGQTAGVDLLTYPQATTSGTNQARLYVGNNMPVVTGVSKNANSMTPLMTNLSFGHNH